MVVESRTNHKLFVPFLLLLLATGVAGCLQPLHTPVGGPLPVPTATGDTGEPSESLTAITPTTTENDAVSTASDPGGESAPPETAAASEQDGPTSSPPSSTRTAETILDEALDFCQLSQEYWQKGELDNAIDALDQAYSLALSVDIGDNSKLFQQKEDLRFLISKRILEIYASRNTAVNGNHKAIPLIMNKHVRHELTLFTQGVEKKFFREAYKRSGAYRPFILEALAAAGLPAELSWLPLIESGFKPNALSKSRALGLWQFIPSTGYKFGLNRDMFIDERLDPEKSTHAAIAYLKELHQIFGDWTTVLAAYNCGEGRVLREIREQNINYLDNFWDLYERLPTETARYVPRFLATLHVLGAPEKYGLDQVVTDPPLSYEIATVARQVKLDDLAAKLGIPVRELQKLNPELRYQILPREEYPLRVPNGKKEDLLLRIAEVPVSTPAQAGGFIYHRVKRGETVSTIARRYHTSAKRIAHVNRLGRRNRIVAGQMLKIPQKGTAYVAQPQPQVVAAVSRQTRTHVVQTGDSLWNIAKRYGTTTREIQRQNNLTTTMLAVGQTLTIQVGPPDAGAPPTEAYKPYQVKRGDSPFKIAHKHNMPLEEFLRINQLVPRSKIYPGQTLFID